MELSASKTLNILKIFEKIEISKIFVAILKKFSGPLLS